ncbi:MAG: hypothetical protein V3T83_07460 [Acidobacteriota bacterium]
MSKKKKKKSPIPPKLRPWAEAKRRHRLSQAHIQMARELGMNPRKFGKLDNHRQERWKMPLRQFIEHLYEKRFNRRHPERVLSFMVIAKEQRRKGEERRARKLARKAEEATAPTEAQAKPDPPQQPTLPGFA